MSYEGDQKREYQRKWVAARRAKWFADKFCVVCGTTELLELDHIDANTKVSHSIWSWSWARIEEEVAKCQVLCQQHHKEKTIRTEIEAFLGKPVHEHGSKSMYSNQGCRCDACREGQARRMQEYRRAS